MSHELISGSEIPYFPFPKNPEKIKIGDFEVHKYIDTPIVDKYIKALSDRNNLRDYDAILVNLWGGWELFKDLRILQNYPKWPSQCEYHHGGVETIPVDTSLRRKKVLVVDDSSESGATIQEIFRRVGYGSRAVVAMTLDGVPGQIFDERIDSAVLIDNLHAAGKGKDSGYKRERQLFRQLREIVVIPKK